MRKRITSATPEIACCNTCPNPRDLPGRKLCSRCLGYRAAERARRKAAGWCACSRPITTPGKSHCDGCRAREAERKARHKAAGLCPCGRFKALPGRQWCRLCQAADTQHASAVRAARRATHLCVECGEVTARFAKTTCAGCGKEAVQRTRASQRRHPETVKRSDAARTARGPRPSVPGKWSASAKRKRARRRAARLCITCGTAPAKPNRASCAGCIGKMLVRFHRRRVQGDENGGTFTPADWKAIKRRQDFKCAECHRREPEITLTLDHVVPVSQGGTNDPANLQGLCGPCNSSKGAKLTTLF